MARRFEAKESTITSDLSRVMTKMGVEQYQLIHSGTSSDVSIVFVRSDGDGNRREYRFDCHTWEHPIDNLRAAQMAITLLWRIFEEYRVSRLENIFAGFRVLPGSTLLLKDAMDPWAVLGLDRGATLAEAKARYRQLARETHPDRGGAPEEFAQIEEAYRLIGAEAKKQ